MEWTPSATATVLLGSSKGMAAAKVSSSAECPTQSTNETDAKKAKMRQVMKDNVQCVILLVKDTDIEELRSNIVLQVKAELFQ